MKKINTEKLLMIFMIIQPFLDFYLLYSEKITNIFRFSPTTIIRMCFIVFFLIYLLFKIKYNKKYVFIILYFLLIGIYLIAHVFNVLNFSNSIASTFEFSYITEAFYYIRLFIPILLVFITYKTDIKEDTFKKTITAISLIFSLEIIITNVFKISLTSYGGDNIISGNILDWFINKKYTFEQLASRGYFYMANQISAVLMMLLPINIYYSIKTSKKINIISSFCLCLAMIMLGTRVATYGWILIASVMFGAWVFFALIHKNKIGLTLKKSSVYIILTLILVFITFNSPLVLRQNFIDYEAIEEQNLTNDIKNKYDELDGKDAIEKFILEYSEIYSIPLTYVKDLYPYKYDSQFWIDVMSLPYSKRGGNRKLQNLITKRVYELNDNKYDKFFGMGYSRFRNAKIYIEQDILVHYYTIGIIGIILFILPIFFITTYSLIYMIIKRKLKMQPTILCGSIYIVMGVSFFSGHVLDELIVTIILGYICGYVLKLISNKPKVDEKNIDIKKIISEEYDKDNPKVSVIVPVYNVEKYIDKCLNSLVNQTYKNIEIIVVNDGTQDNSQKIIDNYSKKYSNVKSFIKKNGGLSSARNYGLKHAKGDYIAFVDSDDWVNPKYIEKLFLKAISNNFDIVVCDLEYIYKNKNRVVSSNIQDDIFEKNDLMKSMGYIYPAVWNKLYSKRLFKKNIRFKLNVWFEDVEFIYKLYPSINSIGVVKEPLYYYLQRPNAITNTFDKRLYDYIYNWNGIIDYYKKNNLFETYKDELEYSYVRYIFATFIKRATKLNNKKEYDNAVDEAIKNVNKNFKDYKKNKYLKNLKLKNLYLRFFNKKLANILFFIKKK